MKTFKVGKRYWMFSPCDQGCTWEYEVVHRTDKMISIIPTDEDGLLPENKTKLKRVKVHQELGEEWAKPLGSYSMCPMLRAGRELK